jgi:hypothetical protein
MLYQEGLKSYLKNDLNSAAAAFEKYIASNDDKYRAKTKRSCADAYARLGYEKLVSGDIQEASRMWMRGAALDGSNSLIKKYMDEYVEVKCNEYFNKGAIEYYNGKIDRARYYWELCEGLNPSYERAAKALRRIR